MSAGSNRVNTGGFGPKPPAQTSHFTIPAESLPASMALLGPTWRTMTLEELPKLLPQGVVVVEIGPDDVCDVWLADGLLAALSSEASPLGAELGSSSSQSQPIVASNGHTEAEPSAAALIALAIEALAPFAAAPHDAVLWDGEKHVPANHPDAGWAPVFGVTWGDLRRAHAVHARLTGERP